MSMTIRMARPDDAPAITAIYAPFVSDTPTSFELIPPTEDEMARRLAKTLAQFPWLVADAAGAVAGYAYASKHRERAAYQWAADVSVYVHKDWRGNGVGRTLYTALFAILRAQGYYNIYAGIALPNPASVALHEAMGMIPVGVYHHVGYKAGAWHDVGWWQGALREPVNTPEPPRALPDIATLPTWDHWLRSGKLIPPMAEAQP
ncbi:MAG: arsinothricin resistance N-acetyltransferase ArsN1 family B [Nitrososphaerota archaeon]